MYSLRMISIWLWYRACCVCVCVFFFSGLPMRNAKWFWIYSVDRSMQLDWWTIWIDCCGMSCALFHHSIRHCLLTANGWNEHFSLFSMWNSHSASPFFCFIVLSQLLSLAFVRSFQCIRSKTTTDRNNELICAIYFVYLLLHGFLNGSIPTAP